MTVYLAGFNLGKSTSSTLSPEHLQLLEYVDESGGLEFYSVRDGRELWVGAAGVQVSGKNSYTQILVKTKDGDTYWPYSIVCPDPSLKSEPDFIRTRVGSPRSADRARTAQGRGQGLHPQRWGDGEAHAAAGAGTAGRGGSRCGG
ncbi:MAG: hypothetical protein DELT_02615 [Desulfovibrio sp.]